MVAQTWRQVLDGKMPDFLAKEIDTFEGQIILKKQGKLDDKLFAETRLRRGAYGQRYDNGKRDDGIRVQKLEYPAGDLLKGPETYWDAPGMMEARAFMAYLQSEPCRSSQPATRWRLPAGRRSAAGSGCPRRSARRCA